MDPAEYAQSSLRVDIIPPENGPHCLMSKDVLSAAACPEESGLQPAHYSVRKEAERLGSASAAE